MSLRTNLVKHGDINTFVVVELGCLRMVVICCTGQFYVFVVAAHGDLYFVFSASQSGLYMFVVAVHGGLPLFFVSAHGGLYMIFVAAQCLNAVFCAAHGGHHISVCTFLLFTTYKDVKL
jgi:hypothetical protein